MAATRPRSAFARRLVSITFPARPTGCRSPGWRRHKPCWRAKAGTPRCDAAAAQSAGFALVCVRSVVVEVHPAGFGRDEGRGPRLQMPPPDGRLDAQQGQTEPVAARPHLTDLAPV